MLNYKFSNHELANMMRSCSYGEDLEVTCNSLFAPTVGYARGQLVVYKSSRYHGIRKNEPQSDLAERLGGRTYYAGLAMSRAYFAGLASHSIVVQSRRSNNTPDLPETDFIISENRDPSHSLPFPSPAERGTTPAPNARIFGARRPKCDEYRSTTTQPSQTGNLHRKPSKSFGIVVRQAR